MARRKIVEGRASARQCAAHLFISEVWFHQLLNKKVIPRQDNYDLDEVRSLYIKHLQSLAAGHGSSAGGTVGRPKAGLADQRALLAAQQTETAAIKNAMLRGDWVPLGKVIEINRRIFGVVRERLLTLPGKLADAMEGLARVDREERCQDEIREILSELQEPTNYGSVSSAGLVPEDADGVDQDVPAAAETDGDAVG